MVLQWRGAWLTGPPLSSAAACLPFPPFSCKPAPPPHPRPPPPPLSSHRTASRAWRARKRRWASGCPKPLESWMRLHKRWHCCRRRRSSGRWPTPHVAEEVAAVAALTGFLTDPSESGLAHPKFVPFVKTLSSLNLLKISLSVTIINFHGCALYAEGANLAASSSSFMISSLTGVLLYFLMLLLFLIASRTSMISLL